MADAPEAPQDGVQRDTPPPEDMQVDHEAELARLRDELAAAGQKRAELEAENAELKLAELVVEKPMSFADKSKIYPRPVSFDSSKGKCTAVAHLTREFDWFERVGVPPRDHVSAFLANLSARDHKKMLDQLKENDVDVATVAHSQFHSLFLSLYGELDPDATAFRKFLAVKQGNKSMQTYCQEFQNASAELSQNVGLSSFVKCFFFLEHMEKSFSEKLALNPQTLGSWTSFAELVQSARHIGSVSRSDQTSSANQSGKSSQKRPRDAQNVTPPVAKKGGVKAAQTPDRSPAEQRYMRAKGLCFHCMQNAGHRSAKCDQKIRGIAAKPLPSEFKAADWPEAQSSKG